jgi:hypothetical protein
VTTIRRILFFTRAKRLSEAADFRQQRQMDCLLGQKGAKAMDVVPKFYYDEIRL